MTENNSLPKSKFFMYKGKPLVRCKDTLYYGNMFDKYVVMLQVITKETSHDIQISKNIKIQLMSTDTNLSPQDMVIKKTEKVGLYNALDVASIWLNRALHQYD